MTEETPGIVEGGVRVGDAEGSPTNGTGTDAGSEGAVTVPSSEPAAPNHTTAEPSTCGQDNQPHELNKPPGFKPLPPLPPPLSPQPSIRTFGEGTDNKPPAQNNLNTSGEMEGGTPKLDRKGSVAYMEPASNHADDKKKVFHNFFIRSFVSQRFNTHSPMKSKWNLLTWVNKQLKIKESEKEKENSNGNNGKPTSGREKVPRERNNTQVHEKTDTPNDKPLDEQTDSEAHNRKVIVVNSIEVCIFSSFASPPPILFHPSLISYRISQRNVKNG